MLSAETGGLRDSVTLNVRFWKTEEFHRTKLKLLFVDYHKRQNLRAVMGHYTEDVGNTKTHKLAGPAVHFKTAWSLTLFCFSVFLCTLLHATHVTETDVDPC